MMSRPLFSLLIACACLSVCLHLSGGHSPAMAADAQEQPKNRVPGPAITPTAWPGGTALPTGKIAIVNHMTFSRGQLYKGSSSYTAHNAAGGKVGARSNHQWNNVFKVRYGLAWDRLDARISIPFINNDIERHSPQGGAWKGGFGDATVLLRYQVLPRTNELPICVAVDAGMVVPTGHTGDKDKYLATNALGFVFGGGASWIDHNQRFDVDGRYVFYREGAHDIRPGDYGLFHAHYAYALTTYFDMGVEGFLRVEGEREIDGKGMDDGYTECFIGPKVQFKVPEWSNFMAGAAVLLPVYRHYDYQRLSPDARFEFRVGFAF